MTEAFSIGFTPLAGTAENRWLRLVQVGADDDIVTMDEAAELIDALYKISPCDTGTGGSGGGENAPEEPTEEEFDALSAEAMGELCAGQDHWDVQVDLLRSHPNPAAWRVQAGDAEHVSTEIVVETRTETVSLDGADHHDLEYPYHGGLAVAGAEVVDVRGSTVNFARPVTGRVRLTYTTRFERLTLRVPATPDEHGQAQAEPASVIAFWDRRAAQLELKQPEPDDGVSAAELADMCRGKDKDKDRPSGGCWERLAHYSLCRCDGSTVVPDSEREETVGADCPEGIRPGSYLGVRRVLDGYGDCPGQEEDVYETAFYEETCCTWPSKTLPRCRRIVRDYSGGAPIEGGADAWRERYGGDVIFTAVAPPDGICGKEITSWNVEKQNCCDGVPPLRPDPDNPVEITVPGRGYGVAVSDGKEGVPYRWRVTGGLVIAQTGTTEWTVRRRDITVQFDEGLCPRPTVTVSDGCTTLRMEFRGPDSAPPRLSSTDLTLAANTRFWLQASGGVRPYMWMATGGLRMLGWSQDGASALFETGGRLEWCAETVTVIDQCGNQDSCGVRNVDTGRWVRETRPHDRRCDPPPVRGGMYERDDPLQSSVNWTVPRGGYRLLLGWNSSGYFSECMVYHDMPTCGPMALFSDGGEQVLWPAFCARPVGGYHSQEVDPSCGCRAKNPRGQTVYAAFGEYINAVEQWVCG